MRLIYDQIALSSKAPLEVIDITAMLRDRLQSSGLREGVVTALSQHTTARLNINECEAQLQRDMVTFLKRLAPQDGDYLHNLQPVDDRQNAHAHLIGLFANASESIPVRDGELLLGAWQSLFFLELDGPRQERVVTLQFLGGFSGDQS